MANAEKLQLYLSAHNPLCYADFVTMKSTKASTVTFLSRIYHQRETGKYEQAYDIPTFQFMSSPEGVEFYGYFVGH